MRLLPLVEVYVKDHLKGEWTLYARSSKKWSSRSATRTCQCTLLLFVDQASLTLFCYSSQKGIHWLYVCFQWQHRTKLQDLSSEFNVVLTTVTASRLFGNMSSCISECGESASVTNASISTDPKNTSVTQNMDEVSKRKRHYSFDDLDNEPEEKPKLRKFSSLNFRKSTSAGATVGPCESIRECPYNERTNTEEVKTGGMHAAFIKSNSQTSEQSDKTAETSSVDSTHSADVVDSYAEIAGQQKCSDLRSTASQRILYVHNQELIDHCNKLPRIPERVCEDLSVQISTRLM